MSKQLKNNIGLVPLILLIFVLPLMVFGKNQNVPETVFPYLNVPVVTDFFTYYRSLFIDIIGLYCGLFLIYNLFVNKKKDIIDKKYFYLFVTYIILSFLSAYNSDEKYISFFGLFGSNEGFFTILSYILICIYTIYIIKNKKQIYFLLYCFLISMLLYSFIPILQYLGKDLFQTDLGKKYISATLTQSNLSFLSRPFSMYFVFANSNQFGIYMAMMFVLSFILLLSRPKKLHYLIFIIATILLLGTNSKAAFISVFLCTSIYLICARYKKVLSFKTLFRQILIIIIVIIGMNYCSNGSVLMQFSRTINEFLNYNKVQVNAAQNISHPQRVAVQDYTSNLNVKYALNRVEISDGILNMYIYSNNGYIQIVNSNNQILREVFYLSDAAFYFDYKLTNELFITVKDHFLVIEDNQGFKMQFYIDYKGLFSIRETTPNISNLEYINGDMVLSNNFCPLKITYFDYNYIFIDCEGKKLNLLMTGQSNYIFEDERYNDYVIWIYGNYLTLQKGSRLLFFEADESQIYTLDNKGEKIYFDKIERIGFKNREFSGSGRGYLFSRSIPLIKRTLLWGHGPDTFIMYYPQNDYIGKTLYLDSYTNFVESPHNLYIKQAINLGFLTMAIFVSIVFNFFYDVYKNIKKNKNSFEAIIILFVNLAFLIVVSFNDPNVMIMVIFFIFLGIGIKANLLNKS